VAIEELSLLGGHIALDFMNTVGDHLNEQPREELTHYNVLARWAVHAGVISGDHAARLRQLAEEQPEAAEAARVRATALREVMYRLLLSTIRHEAHDDADLATFNEALVDAPARSQIIHEDGNYVWQFTDEVVSLDDPLWRVLWAVADLLTSDQLARVKLCEGDDCGWVFLDTSRNGSRRWCSMADCGNRAKANRYYQRHRGE
jgi:predicted RNA-binding Zn ribbon-like protein